VTFSSRDARTSAQVADAFAKAYVDTMLELRVEPTRQAAVWYDEQLKSLRQNLEDAQSKLTSYLSETGSSRPTSAPYVDNSRLGALSEQVVKAQDRRSNGTPRCGRRANSWKGSDPRFSCRRCSTYPHSKAEDGPATGRSEAATSRHSVRRQPSAVPESTLRERSLRAKIDGEARNSSPGSKLGAPEPSTRSGPRELDAASARACSSSRRVATKLTY